MHIMKEIIIIFYSCLTRLQFNINLECDHSSFMAMSFFCSDNKKYIKMSLMLTMRLREETSHRLTQLFSIVVQFYYLVGKYKGNKNRNPSSQQVFKITPREMFSSISRSDPSISNGFLRSDCSHLKKCHFENTSPRILKFLLCCKLTPFNALLAIKTLPDH